MKRVPGGIVLLGLAVVAALILGLSWFVAWDLKRKGVEPGVLDLAPVGETQLPLPGMDTAWPLGSYSSIRGL